MPSIEVNLKTWAETYDWRQLGEEWSRPWGSSMGQWTGTIWPRLATVLPVSRVLEIAPGFGRWTQYLVPLCRELIGIDLSAKCVDACRIRFPTGVFIVNDGLSLSGALGEFDLVFSFDSLVHAEIEVFESYIPQVIKLLTPSGVAFVHHANSEGSNPKPRGYRAVSVSNEKITDLISGCGGKVLCQETISAGGNVRGDGITLFARSDAFSEAPQMIIDCPDSFDIEARHAREVFNKYSSALGRNTTRTS